MAIRSCPRFLHLLYSFRKAVFPVTVGSAALSPCALPKPFPASFDTGPAALSCLALGPGVSNQKRETRNGSEYQNKFKENSSKMFQGRSGALPWGTQFASFRGAACASGGREWNRTLNCLWWQDYRLPTAGWHTDITVRPAPIFAPQTLAPNGSTFEQLPTNSGSRRSGM
jgi:hypothetical protein